jgi:uncharacterized flavoprotein (TIGR03862 family)
MPQATAAIIGGGPAGLIAAEILSAAGVAVTLYDRMPSIGRKFLMAGRGGLNLTHSEGFETFVERYAEAAPWMRPLLEALPPAALTAWAEGLGQPVFTGSSGRIFPKAMKASPLLRAWLARLAAQGVIIRTRHDWKGWDDDGALVFDTPGGRVTARADATLLAMGGASWPRLGSDGLWAQIISQRNVKLASFQPANMGVTIAWSDMFRDRFAGQPLKGIAIRFAKSVGDAVTQWSSRGDAVVTRYGLEGGVIYAIGALLRSVRQGRHSVSMTIDLRPQATEDQLATRLSLAPPGQSIANVLRKAVKLSPLEVNLLREAHGRDLPRDPAALAHAIKAVTLPVAGVQGLERAISTAGGIALDQLDETLMIRALPGVFAAGEMLDWEAPTGGYLLQACLATGNAAAKGMLARLGQRAA